MVGPSFCHDDPAHVAVFQRWPHHGDQWLTWRVVRHTIVRGNTSSADKASASLELYQIERFMLLTIVDKFKLYESISTHQSTCSGQNTLKKKVHFSLSMNSITYLPTHSEAVLEVHCYTPFSHWHVLVEPSGFELLARGRLLPERHDYLPWIPDGPKYTSSINRWYTSGP